MITCARQHTWTAGFVAREGHRWCRICPEMIKRERKQKIEEEQAKERARIAEAQRKMFAQAEAEMIGEEVKETKTTTVRDAET